MSAANAGFGGGSSGGWVGAGGREPRGPAAEAECALRLGKVKVISPHESIPGVWAALHRMLSAMLSAMFSAVFGGAGPQEDEYMLLCGPPLSALQAFAVAVSSLAH